MIKQQHKRKNVFEQHLKNYSFFIQKLFRVFSKLFIMFHVFKMLSVLGICLVKNCGEFFV